jgi:hypothetical protein
MERAGRSARRCWRAWPTALAALERDDEALDAFAGLYREHIQAEEDIAYPAAQALLDDGSAAHGRRR